MLLIADRLVHVNLETEFRYSLPNLTLTMQALPYLATQIHSYNFLGVKWWLYPIRNLHNNNGKKSQRMIYLNMLLVEISQKKVSIVAVIETHSMWQIVSIL